MAYSLRGGKESDTTQRLSTAQDREVQRGEGANQPRGHVQALSPHVL